MLMPADSAPYGMACRTPDEVTQLKANGTAPPTAHDHVQRYFASGLWSPGTDSSLESSMTAFDTEVSPYVYASFYVRADPDWQQKADTDNNFKMYSFSAGNGPYEKAGFFYFHFEGFKDPGGGIGTGSNYFTGPQLFTACAVPQGHIRCVDDALVN